MGAGLKCGITKFRLVLKKTNRHLKKNVSLWFPVTNSLSHPVMFSLHAHSTSVTIQQSSFQTSNFQLTAQSGKICKLGLHLPGTGTAPVVKRNPLLMGGWTSRLCLSRNPLWAFSPDSYRTPFPLILLLKVDNKTKSFPSMLMWVLKPFNVSFFNRYWGFLVGRSSFS